MTVFANRVFKQVIIKVNEVIGWTAIQYNWCPSKKRRLGHKHRKGKTNVKTQGEHSPSKSQRERPQTETNTGNTFILDLWPLEL